MLDCIIIGTGPGGLSAALNLKTYGKDFVWFGSRSLSGKVQKAEEVTNYPGFPKVTGEELLAAFQEHIKSAGLTITEKTVTTILKGDEGFCVLADNEIYEAKTLILATGVMTAKQLEGEAEFLGRGVSYCATCDGMLYRGKKIAVISNDPKYEHEVEFLAGLASEVLYYPLGYTTELQNEKITLLEKYPKAVAGGFKANKLIFTDDTEVAVDGIFCLRNAIAPSSMFAGLLVEEGHILVDRAMKTNYDGCFACGDCTGRPYQYTKAVGEGNVAAHSVIAYLAEQKKAQ
ncbi:MAG: NAD(P)/FAD-dependent oxidoreductase [Acetatifactor sp.]|nr:NAD(P)/FAD-dependent oxidoreductase [Acetatifactor sp.]